MTNEQTSELVSITAGWSVDRSVPVSLIVVLIGQAIVILVTGTIYATKIDARMTALEDARTSFKQNQTERDSRQDAALKDFTDQTARQYDKLDAKLDRLIESQKVAR